jgi:hypothetical protein
MLFCNNISKMQFFKVVMPQINPDSHPAITPINQSQQCPLTSPESASRLSRAIGFVCGTASKLQAYACSHPSSKASKFKRATKIVTTKTNLPDENRILRKYQKPRQETLGQRLYRLRTVGLSGDPIAAAKQLMTRTPANIIEDVFQMSAKQAGAYLQQYSFQEDGLYTAAELALHIEQYNAEPHWAEQFKLLPHTLAPGDVIEVFTKNSEEVATLYNHHYLSNDHRMVLENYLKGVEYKEIKKLWNDAFYKSDHELLQVLVHTGMAEKVMGKFATESKNAIIEVMKEGDANLLKLLLMINAFKPNVPLEGGQYLIHWAVENHQQDIFDLLLENPRVNFMLRNADDDMPIMIAERKGYLNMQEQLLNRTESALYPE